MSARPPEEIARRALPWYLLPRFQNVLLSIPRDIESYKAKLIINEVTTVFVPGASRFLVVPRVDFDAQDNPKEKKLTVRVMDGWIQGFLPNGKYSKFLAKTVLDDKNEIEVRYRDTYTNFAVANVVKNYLRIKTGPLFAFKVEQYAKKNGLDFTRMRVVDKYHEIYEEDKGKSPITLARVIIREKSAYTTIELPVFLYEMSHNGRYIGMVPGIVPGVVKAIGDGLIDPLSENPDAKQALTDFIDELVNVGKKLAPVSATTLQQTSKSKFTYIIGEVDGPDAVFENIKNTLKASGRKLMWITGAPAYKGTRVNFYLNPENRKIYMTISILPFNAPAVMVLNYPPFSIAPLSALMYQRHAFLRYNLDKVERLLEKKGLKVGFYDMDYEVLADAEVTFDEIRDALREGYPRFSTLRPLLEKMEKLGYIGDVISHAYGKETKLEEVLVKELKPLIARYEKAMKPEEVEAKQEAVTEPEEEEAEVIL